MGGKAGLEMTADVFEQRVAALTSGQEANTTALIEEYRKDLSEVQSTALRYVRTGGDHGPENRGADDGHSICRVRFTRRGPICAADCHPG